jgi:hypothetical protein
MRPPGLGLSHFHNVPSPTPRCEQTVRLSVYPRLLSAFPRRRYGRLTQLSITRLMRVHGYYGPLFCIFVQGHLSRRFAPPTRPPARSPNGRLGPGDLHPISLTSVPACRLRTRLGAPKAITAMARKLACLFYRLIKHGQQYVDRGTEYYEARYREQQIRSLTKRAQKLGLQLVIPKTA